MTRCRRLEDEVREGRFREDLYYRLNVMPVYPAPLRDRMEDLPELAAFLLEKISQQQDRKLCLTDDALRQMMNYDWPGNIRQLENLLERASVMSENGTIDSTTLSLDHQIELPSDGSTVGSRSPQINTIGNVGTDQIDRARVIAALEQAGWVQAKAARLLNMTPRQIAYRIQTMNIKMRQL